MEPSLLHRGFSLSGFHVNLCVCTGLISKIYPSIYTTWWVDNSPGITHCTYRVKLLTLSFFVDIPLSNISILEYYCWNWTWLSIAKFSKWKAGSPRECYIIYAFYFHARLLSYVCFIRALTIYNTRCKWATDTCLRNQTSKHMLLSIYLGDRMHFILCCLVEAFSLMAISLIDNLQ